jgi:glutathione peroxidase-family protein
MIMLCRVAIILFLVGINFKSSSQTIPNLSFKNIDGNNVNLHNDTIRKKLFIVVPVAPDSLFVSELLQFQSNYPDSVVRIIGILSYELGYQDSLKNQVKSIYQSSFPHLLLTEGLHSTGNNKSALIKWLTEKNLNRRFELSSTNDRQKFIINKRGQLVAIINPIIPVNTPFVTRFFE